MQTIQSMTQMMAALAAELDDGMDAEVILFCRDCKSLGETGNVTINGNAVQVMTGPTEEQRAFRNLSKYKRSMAAAEALEYLEERLDAPTFAGLVNDYLDGHIGKEHLEERARDLPVVKFDADEAHYVGNEDDGCYYQVGQGFDGNAYVTVVVDSDTGSFVSDLETDSGPFDEYDQAAAHGACVAEGWCVDNGVDFGNPVDPELADLVEQARLECDTPADQDNLDDLVSQYKSGDLTRDKLVEVLS
jgi:hypothetical protein